MPLSVYRKLGLGEAKPTTVSLQLADRSIKYPRGILEDVLVKVDKFIFPADFLVLDMEEDEEIPIILGRPFLATGRALIDVHDGKLTLRVQNEQVTFDILKPWKHPGEVDSCMKLDTIDGGTKEKSQASYQVDPKEVKAEVTKSVNKEVYGSVQGLEAAPNIHLERSFEDLGQETTKLLPFVDKPPIDPEPKTDIFDPGGPNNSQWSKYLKHDDVKSEWVNKGIFGQGFQAYNEGGVDLQRSNITLFEPP